jgi:hypothetical protein
VSATDFRQATGSPTIDSGRTAGLLGTLDLDGAPRAFGAKPDIGAYEWTGEPVVDGGQQPGGGGQQDGSQQPEQREQERPPHNHNDFVQPDPKPLPGVALTRQTITVKKNVAAVKIECPAGGACAGTLTLQSGKVKVGSGKFNVPAGKRAVVRIKLSRAARKLIARKRKLKATATAQASKAPITLKLPARRR